MELVKTKIWLVALPAVLLVSGCTSIPKSSSHQHSDVPLGQFLLAPSPNFQSSEFSKRWNGSITEQDKIRYLLERIGSCNNRFIRNGQIHNGLYARQWLLYKLGHWVSGVETAEDFVNRVAAFSQKTGRAYLVECDGKNYSLKSVLQSELAAFEKNRISIVQSAPALVANPSKVSVSAIPTVPASK